MDKMYCYNYLKDYILEVGHRIVGFDKTILEDNDTLHEFIDARAQLAVEEFERNSDLSGGCSHELAMQTLLADLTELEPTEEEKEAEQNTKRNGMRCMDIMRSNMVRPLHELMKIIVMNCQI